MPDRLDGWDRLWAAMTLVSVGAVVGAAAVLALLCAVGEVFHLPLHR